MVRLDEYMLWAHRPQATGGTAMTALDWLLVVVINLGIVIYGVVMIRSKDQTFDYFLAAKTLPWWAIGLSAFGTAVDTGDYVAVAGGAYRFGISQLAFWWLGLAVGWFVLSFFVMQAMYRTGMYTNAEWLEFRFGPATRVLAVFINLQSRTNVLGNIYFSVFLVLSVVAGIPPGWAWAVVVGVAVTAVLYIWTGGLRSAVVASVVTAITLWFNITMGPLARVDFPALNIIDQAYPLMIKKYLPAGLVGIVVAGLVAAAYSTFDSIGIGLSSLFVRDIYSRFFVQRAADAHYALVGRISVPVIIALGFVYVPFLTSGMFAFYIRLAGAISVPLMTVMLMGVFTRVHRATGIIGLVVGLVYGLSAILADFNKWGWPAWYVST